MATAESFIEELKTLVTRNMEANAQIASRVSTLVQQASRGGLPTDANDLFSRWLDFNLASASLLSAHSMQVMEGVVTAAERSLLGRMPPPKNGVPEPESAPPVDLHVEGRAGETVRAPFLIANEYDRPLEVTFEATALQGTSGAVIAADGVTFEPAALTLGRGERVVQAAVAIPKESAVGETFRGAIRMRGYQARTIHLAVTVVAAEGGKGAKGGSADSSAGAADSAARGAPAKRGSSRSGGGGRPKAKKRAKPST